MSDPTEFRIPPKLKMRLRQIATEEWHGKAELEFQNGRIFRWAVTEFGRVKDEPPADINRPA